MTNIKLKENGSKGRKRTSDKFNCANTRHLTRILTLLKVFPDEMWYKKRLSEHIGVGDSRKVEDALNWLVNNGLIRKYKSSDKKWKGGMDFYALFY